MAFWDDIYRSGINASQDFNRSVYGREIKNIGDIGGAIMGDQRRPGLLGLGTRTPNQVNVDPGAAGLPGYEQDRARSLAGIGQFDARGGPMADYARLNMAPQAQFRNGQMDLVQALTMQANGQGPSLAQGQLQQATDRNLAQAMALGQSMGGAQGAGLAQRNILQQQAGMSQQAASDSSLLRLQEQLQARNMLGQVLAGARGQDIGLAAEQAGLQQQSLMGNQNAALQQMSLNDAMRRFYEQQATGLAQTQGGMNMGMAGLQQQAGFANEQLAQNAYDEAARRRQALMQTGAQVAGNAAGGAGSALVLAAMSDERLKTDIEDAGDDLDSFLDALTTNRYRYKEPKKDGEGERVSVMAQDLERTAVGKTFVRSTPRGKQVDYAAGFGVNLASLARLHKRIRKLEGAAAS